MNRRDDTEGKYGPPFSSFTTGSASWSRQAFSHSSEDEISRPDVLKIHGKTIFLIKEENGKIPLANAAPVMANSSESQRKRFPLPLIERFSTDAMNINAEKRSFGRKIICQSVRIEMSTLKYGQMGHMPENGLGVDISHGGIGLITDCSLEEGNLLKLYFPVAEAKVNLPVYAQVVWVMPARGKYRVGLCFWDKPAWKKSHRPASAR